MNLLTIFSGPWAWLIRIGLYAALVGAIWGYGWVKGDEHGSQKLVDYANKQASQAIHTVSRQQQVTEKVIEHYTQVAGKTKTVTEYVTQEVEKYVPTPGVCFDPEFRRLHDAATVDTIPSPRLKADDQIRAAYAPASN